MTASKSPIKVTHFQRRGGNGNFSVERLFEDARAHMPSGIDVSLTVNKYMSRGVWGRLADALEASKRTQAVNHVLGDVHYLTWFLPRERTVLTVLDCVSLERLSGVKRQVLWFLWYYLPLKKAAAVTVISTFTRDSLLEWVSYPVAQIYIIPPSVCPVFQFSPRTPVLNRNQRVLQIGTKPNKNILRLVEALSGLPVKLVLVGVLDAPQEEALRKYHVEFENLIDLSLEEIVEQYEQADVVSFVSTYEGFGMPIVEAQATGRPVVTSNVCSMPETAGGAAILVDPFDVNSIRSGFQRALEDQSLVTDLIEKGRENAKKYSAEEIAQAYAALYRHVDSQATS